MKPLDGDDALYTQWDGPVAFRLFADGSQPTLTVPEQIAAKVGDRILDGRLAPGERIREQSLADEFAVSRGPVREAIRILEREGLATILPRRGAIVTELSAGEVGEIFEIRAGLLEIVARKSIAHRDEQLLALLRACVARLEALAELDDDGGRYAETTYRIGLIGAHRCGNRRLTRMLASLSLQTLRYSKLGLASKARRAESVALWREALDAYERGDAHRYAALARQRIEASGDEVVRRLTLPTERPRAARNVRAGGTEGDTR
ncbi:MAG: GntR family transcriptional regulator [Burkholderiaceae bacterium]